MLIFGRASSSSSSINQDYSTMKEGLCGVHHPDSPINNPSETIHYRLHPVHFFACSQYSSNGFPFGIYQQIPSKKPIKNGGLLPEPEFR
jgi:hypothetical protein